jgi:hypothetical protein
VYAGASGIRVYSKVRLKSCAAPVQHVSPMIHEPELVSKWPCKTTAGSLWLLSEGSCAPMSACLLGSATVIHLGEESTWLGIWPGWLLSFWLIRTAVPLLPEKAVPHNRNSRLCLEAEVSPRHGWGVHERNKPFPSRGTVFLSVGFRRTRENRSRSCIIRTSSRSPSSRLPP